MNLDKPFDFSEMIHEERSKCLRSLPPFSGTVLSAGCAGAWYFDWFSECTKHQGRHIGLELYSPKPAGLPPHVEWIANSVENMEAVGDSSIDLIFSGQNVEHLASSSLAGFLIESNRVLKTGGLLVVDSPNRSVTEHLGYAQPEHSLELTVDEMTELLSLAGFEIVDVRGIWLVIDPVTHKRLDFGSCRPGEITATERCSGAIKNPQSSFIWWINARKKTGVDAGAIRRFADDLFWKYYKGFVSARFNSLVGTKAWHWGSATVELKPQDTGYALYGPYIPLAEGKYIASFGMQIERAASANCEITLDVISAGASVTHGKRVLSVKDFEANRGWAHFHVPFELSAYTTSIEARCHVRGVSGALIGRADFLTCA